MLYGSVHSSRAQCIALGLCTQLQGLCTLFSSCSLASELLLQPLPLLPQPRSSITARSQPPPASPGQPLTACVSGHTSISQGQQAQHRWPLAPWGTWPAPGGPPAVAHVGQALPTLTTAFLPWKWGPCTAMGNLLYIDPFGVVFSIFIGNRGVGFVWFVGLFFLKTLYFWNVVSHFYNCL